MKKERKKVLVLTDHMPWGHRSIAKAIYNYLKVNEKENNLDIYYAEIKAKTGIAGDLYVFTYRFFPRSNRIAHKISGKKVSRDLIREFSRLNLTGLKKEIEKIEPDLIISTYFFHSHSLVKWKKDTNKKFKLWTVAADPWTINPISFIKDADLNILYDDISLKEGLKFGLDKNKTMVTGWWTRPEMYKKFNREEVRNKLGFTDDRPVIFVGGGSLGMNSLPKLLPTILTLKKKVGFIINTGTDKLAYNLVEQFIKIVRKLKKDNLVVIKNFGWIDNMAEVLSACDIVFGKAGPNFLFDVMAANKPFIAMTHIGGQEDGNIDLIRKKKLGLVKEKNGEISDFLFEYLKDPGYFEKKFLKNIEKERELNRKSLPLILEKVKEVLK